MVGGTSSLITLILLAFTVPATAGDVAEASDCYDRVIFARLVEQVPSPLPEADDGSIVFAWPWFLDFEIVDPLSGEMEELTALAIMHTYYVSNLPAGPWYLRLNSDGGYNVVGRSNDAPILKCPLGTAPARPYLSPGPERSLAEIRREGEEIYGRAD